MKRGETSSGVLVALLKNEHQVAESDFTVGLTGRTVVRMQRTREGYCVPSRCCSYCLITQLREFDTATLHATNCRYVLQSEDGEIDPPGRGITPSVRPQIASPEEASQLPRYCASNQRQPNLVLKFTDNRKRVGIFYHDGIENRISGKPTAVLVSVEQSYS